MFMYKLFVGYDSNRPEIFEACERSIRKYSDIEVNKISTTLLPESCWWRERSEKENTEFSICRFLIPFLSDYEGISLFMDDDFIVTCDPAEVVELFDEQYDVQVVQHDYVPKKETKWLTMRNHPYDKKNWSSMMLFNNAKCKILSPFRVNASPGLYLHQFDWAEKVGALPREYNHLVGEYKERPAKFYHFTNGIDYPLWNELNDYRRHKSKIS